MTKKVVVHVGTPKTGTSFVQDLLFQQRDALAEQGVLYPVDRFDAHFLAALDLMELRWGGLEHQAVGAWDRLAAQVRAWEGHTVVISHEILARASVEQVRLAMDSFGPGCEVHVVLSARDLVRQIPAEWQENVKHRRTVAFHDFLDQITADVPETEVATWFWGVQEVPAILARWGSILPPSQVHVVTVPKPGSPRTLLWERFAAVFGLDPQAWATESERSNPSLGAPETALVRAINQRVNGGVLANEHYRELVRETLAHRTLAHRSGSPRLVLPPDVRAWAAELSQRWIAELEAREYDVVGSLEDLRADALDGTESAFTDPDDFGPAELGEPALDAVVSLLQRAAEMREEISRLHEELHHTRGERDAAFRAAGLVFRAKNKLVRSAETHRSAHVALKAYRKVRGR